MTDESKYPETGGEDKHAPGRGATIRDWWPHQLNLKILHQHSPLSNPMEKGFSYAEEFRSLDLAAVKSALTAAGYTGPVCFELSRSSHMAPKAVVMAIKNAELPRSNLRGVALSV